MGCRLVKKSMKIVKIVRLIVKIKEKKRIILISILKDKDLFLIRKKPIKLLILICNRKFNLLRNISNKIRIIGIIRICISFIPILLD